MSWIGMLVIVILAVNVVFFGSLVVFSFIEDWRKRKNEQRGHHKHKG